MNKPNPINQIIYLIISIGGFYIYVSVAFMKYCPGPYFGEYHKYTVTALIFLCHYSFYKASTLDPGVIHN